MFAESMLETSWAQRTRRSWTTLTSFGLQALIIGCLLLLPLWKTIGLPAARVLSGPLSWGTPAPPAPRVQHQRTVTVVRSNLADNELVFFKTRIIKTDDLDGTSVARRTAINGNQAVIRLAGFA